MRYNHKRAEEAFLPRVLALSRRKSEELQVVYTPLNGRMIPVQNCLSRGGSGPAYCGGTKKSGESFPHLPHPNPNFRRFIIGQKLAIAWMRI